MMMMVGNEINTGEGCLFGDVTRRHVKRYDEQIWNSEQIIACTDFQTIHVRRPSQNLERVMQYWNFYVQFKLRGINNQSTNGSFLFTPTLYMALKFTQIHFKNTSILCSNLTMKFWEYWRIASSTIRCRIYIGLKLRYLYINCTITSYECFCINSNSIEMN